MINKQCVPLFIFVYRCWCISIFKLLLLTQHPFYCNIFKELGERASLLTIQRRCPVFTSFQNKNSTTCSYSLECSQTFPETSTDKKIKQRSVLYNVVLQDILFGISFPKNSFTSQFSIVSIIFLSTYDMYVFFSNLYK